MDKTIGLGIVGLVFLGGVLAMRYWPDSPLTEKDILDIASKDDPKIGDALPLVTKKIGKDSAIIFYLPACTGCTRKDLIPNPIPENLKGAVFIKRTNQDIPEFIPKEAVLIDEDGTIQRSLNAYRLPRIYSVRVAKLDNFQKLDEDVMDFLHRFTP